MNRKYILSTILFLSLSLLFAGNAVYASAEENKTICQGVYIDEVNVSGMTKAQAEVAVEEFMKGLQSKGIAIKVGDNIVYSTMGALGYTYEPNDDIEQALDFGKSGNLIKRYKDLKDIEQGNVVLPLSFTYDKNKINQLVNADVSAYNVAPINASVKRENGKFIYTDHVVGKKVNVDKTAQLIEDAMTNWNRQDIIVDAVVEDDMPMYTKDIVEQCNTVLGSFTTDYSTSASGRAANLENGARLINNTVLYPGDVFSAYNQLTPFTEENGYSIAGAYLNGIVVDSVGGGACQVTTTLYNAVLAAELEVKERQPHSMTISYVDLSRDAAIAGTYKDFKFVNNTDTPIVIEASTKNRKITFKIWGHETRDTVNRKIEYVTKVLSEKKPPADVITEDPTQPTTYRKVTQTAHIGYRAELYKVVYENGVEVSRTLVNTSNYQAAPQYVTVGTKKVQEDKDTTNTGTTDNTKTGTDNQTNDTTNNNSGTTNDQPNTDTSGQSNTDGNQSDGLDPTWDLEVPLE
ncbi:MAG TPA: VanW family protein [Mobilitalea sp.]|nr:VanW family protein [Mobilitalea sp.]